MSAVEQPLDTVALHKALADLQAELAAQRQEMQDFAYAVSHDLRAPLRHIVSFAQIVQDEAGPTLDPEHQSFLRTVTDSAHKLGGMLDGLLAFSRIGTADLDIHPVPLAVLVAELVDKLQHGASPAVQWQVQVPADLLVQADIGMLRTALQAVLDNAVKFTQGRPHAWVRITVDADADTIKLLVQDNGAGCPTEACVRLGKVFSRAHSATAYPGQGVGLAIARKALQRMGASLHLHGVPDAGFTATLELLPAAATESVQS
ncbi:HAMP domain-containing histidine kinase [Curvibacter sp. CHRR-16]|uniref:sensor histidine kinase n=1 Tax=Curvibacter sp. CHRR-16 TaxID=2835872 RepID=UPI001BDB140B|nr:HAMP domain-containing sensor histidine kinase [Curvibacter sp. CHRR-16]MBT0570913.1 HAMP domain-containing histidine kinase [Curvibacter sp. CHRR-16]